MNRKILITGASGLLGSQITGLFSAHTAVVPAGYAHSSDGMLKIDLMDERSIDILDRESWDTVIHCAAFRSPDFCEKEQGSAYQMNVTASMRIAEIAERRSAQMVFISTDYVFDGQTPPYSETSLTSPVNYYGRTKLEAERAVLDICSDPMVVRIPVLYGDTPRPGMCAFLENSINSIISGIPVKLDNHTVKHPTYTTDVGQVLLFLLETGFSGIIHVSSPEMTTNYEWTLRIAEELGIDTSHIQKEDNPPRMAAARPVNSKLSINLLKKLGAPMPRGYTEILNSLDIIRQTKKQRGKYV